jgi:hypothetical protein
MDYYSLWSDKQASVRYGVAMIITGAKHKKGAFFTGFGVVIIHSLMVHD